MSDVICVTNRSLCQDDFLSRIEEAAQQHPTGILLREKDLDEEEYKQLAKQVMRICKKYQVTCILHNFADVAEELGAEALHLPLPKLRELSEVQRKKIRMLGASCHSVEEAREAVELGCTYLIAGHIFATDCKKGLSGRGTEFLKEVCESVQVPVYAIGGISGKKMSLIHEAGAKGGCIMSGWMQCADVEEYLSGFDPEGKEEKMKFQKEQLMLYAVTDRAWEGKLTLLQQIEEALKGGVTILQLREKGLSEEAFVEEAILARELCHRYGVPLIINDNVEVAIKSGADGVHVGIEDQPVAEIRQRIGSDFIIGATAKTVEQAKAAEAAGADYLGVGAVFPSPTKKNAIRITKEQLQKICASVSIPAVAIGGISAENVEELQGGGMCGVAVVSAVFAAENIEKAAARLKEQVRNL
jgi:thiamine-phosphate pyrophosphorylase